MSQDKSTTTAVTLETGAAASFGLTPLGDGSFVQAANTLPVAATITAAPSTALVPVVREPKAEENKPKKVKPRLLGGAPQAAKLPNYRPPVYRDDLNYGLAAKVLKRHIENLIQMQNPSYADKNPVREYARTVLSELKREGFIDDAYNIVAYRLEDGEDIPRRAIVAHTDSVDQREGEEVEPFNLVGGVYTSRNRRRPIGGDDKVGVAIALTLAQFCPWLDVILTADEEVGCVGAGKLDLNFMLDLAVECDRRGALDMVHTIGNTAMLGRTAKDYATRLLPHRNPCEGALTDVKTFRARGMVKNATNLSCGYFEPHSRNEFIVFSFMWQTLQDAWMLLSKLPYDLPAADRDSLYRSYNEEWYNGDYYGTGRSRYSGGAGWTGGSTGGGSRTSTGGTRFQSEEELLNDLEKELADFDKQTSGGSAAARVEASREMRTASTALIRSGEATMGTLQEMGFDLLPDGLHNEITDRWLLDDAGDAWVIQNWVSRNYYMFDDVAEQWFPYKHPEGRDLVDEYEGAQAHAALHGGDGDAGDPFRPEEGGEYPDDDPNYDLELMGG